MVAAKGPENHQRERSGTSERGPVRLLASFLLVLGLLLASIGAAEPVRILFVGAHPDDDSGATACLGELVAEGRARVAVVTLSRGEGGGNALGPESGSSLGRLREREERAALGTLGIDTVDYLDRVDWGYTTSEEVTDERWDGSQVLSRLVTLVRRQRPDVIVTMNPYPSGHGHHQFAARMATEAYFAAGDPSLKDGLDPWTPRRLVYALSYGQEGFAPDFVYRPTPAAAERELRALRLYASQGWDALPELGPAFVLGPEAFAVAHTRVPGSVSMLDGLEGTPGTPRSSPPPPPDLTVELAPIPEVARYRDWAGKLGLDLVVARPEATMVVGRPSRVPLELSNRTREPRLVTVAPPATPAVRWLSAPGPVQVPPGTSRAELVGEALRTGPIEIPEGVLEGVPWLVVPPCRRPWTIDGTLEAEGPGTALTELWEGAASHCQGRFWLEWEPDWIDLAVEVQDDVVVSQIAPQDAAGHWRTDAVELTLDPSGASPSTLTTFKLGIIAFTRQGQPLAFRDADARPGPVPGLEVATRRTPTGYALEARIPRAEIGPLAPEFGLNVLLYDADDARADTGANANLSRVGWSAWPEVMGNPRLWGRAALEGSASPRSKAR